MVPMKCPDCGSQRFYVKDPEDQYNIFEFDLKEGEIVCSDKEAEGEPLEVVEETETFCDRCAWHDKFKTLKQVK
jgi:hypothetical protein